MNLFFHALSDPNRITILNLLKEKDMCVNEILVHFSFRQATLSHHLKILKQANIISSQRRWQYIYYSIKKDIKQNAANYLYELTKNNENTIDNV